MMAPDSAYSRDLKTWRQMIHEERAEQGDESPVQAVAPNDAALDVRFDSGFGGSAGPPFTVWTAKRVYFPVVYDGAEWVGSVSRDPDGEPTHHFGGE